MRRTIAATPYLADVYGKLVYSGNLIKNLNAGGELGHAMLLDDRWEWIGESGARCGIPEHASSDPQFGIELMGEPKA